MGISSEVEDLPLYTTDNTSLLSLLQMLGPNGVWRIGGGAVDEDPPIPITQDMANGVGAFASALGWNLIIGLNASHPELDVSQAQTWLTGAPNQNVAFQTGNEPDYLFPSNPQAWANIFNSAYQALPGASWAGPDTTWGTVTSWNDITIPGSGGMEYITIHRYGFFNDGNLYLSPDQVLADATQLSPIANRLAEFGIVACGGLDGVTNATIVATYYLLLAQNALANGFDGLNPHNVLIPEPWCDGLTRPAYYSQFKQLPDGSWGPQGTFYGMYLWAQLVGQQTLAVSAPGLDLLATVTATAGPNGNANILVVNGDADNGIVVQPQQTYSWQTANVLMVLGEGGCTDPNPTLNGYPIGEGGSWSGLPIVNTFGQDNTHA
jgi:hypothetical protein